ncbi:MAG: hypothetical protein JRD47_06920 [Deltaproteobacteria bacterium]|nr:hypothetical protein [Deltaproteobacteria bacterium]
MLVSEGNLKGMGTFKNQTTLQGVVFWRVFLLMKIYDRELMRIYNTIKDSRIKAVVIEYRNYKRERFVLSDSDED